MPIKPTRSYPLLKKCLGSLSVVIENKPTSSHSTKQNIYPYERIPLEVSRWLNTKSIQTFFMDLNNELPHWSKIVQILIFFFNLWRWALTLSLLGVHSHYWRYSLGAGSGLLSTFHLQIGKPKAAIFMIIAGCLHPIVEIKTFQWECFRRNSQICFSSFVQVYKFPNFLDLLHLPIRLSYRKRLRLIS